MKLSECIALHAYDITKRKYRAEELKDWDKYEWNDGWFLFKNNEFHAYRGLKSKNWLKDGIKQVKKIGIERGLRIIKTEADEHIGKFLLKNDFYEHEGVYKCVLKK